MMHQKKIAKLKHKVFYKNKPRINSSGNSKSQRPNILSIPSITKRFDNANNNSRLGGGKKTLALHHNLAYVSCSIPLLSISALLLVLGLSFSPELTRSLPDLFNSVDKTYAVGVGDEETVPVDYLTTYNSGSSLTITPAASGGHGASNSEATLVTPGTVAYRSHDVHVHLEDATSYALQVSYSSDNTALKLDGGNIVYSDVPASGVTGSNMTQKTWGFAWGNTTDIDANMTYYKMPQFNQSGTNIQNGGLEIGDASGNTVDFTKKLVFGASFTPTAVSGHYTTSILLSLSAAAKDITNLAELAELGNMQGMTPDICENTKFVENNPEANSYALTDLRNIGTKYNVVKLRNGECWMNQNLALDLCVNGQNRTLTPADSNVKKDWLSTTGSGNTTWGSTSNDNISRYYNGTNGSNYSSTYGYFYSFQAVTAGEGSSAISDGDNITQDICPKGWRLPTRTEFEATAVGSTKGTWSASNGWIAKDDSGLFFLNAGYVLPSSSPQYVSAGGVMRYWSSTSKDDKHAYGFGVNSSVDVASYERRWGFPVRCIAKKLGDV